MLVVLCVCGQRATAFAWLISLYVSIRLTLSLRIGASAGFRGCFRKGVCATSGVSSEETGAADAAALSEHVEPDADGAAGGGCTGSAALMHEFAEHERGVSISIRDVDDEPTSGSGRVRGCLSSSMLLGSAQRTKGDTSVWCCHGHAQYMGLKRGSVIVAVVASGWVPRPRDEGDRGRDRRRQGGEQRTSLEEGDRH